MGNTIQKQTEELVSSIKNSSLRDETKQEFLEIAKSVKTESDLNKAKSNFEEKILSQKQTEDDSKPNEVDSESIKPSEEKIDPLENFGAFLHSNKEAAEFYSISILTGTVSATEEPSELVKRQFLADFEAWKIAGKPRPTMPQIPKGTVKIPTASYRIRDRKTNRLYTYFNDGTVDGIKEEYFKKTAIDPVSGGTIETDEIDDKRKPVLTFDNEFSPEKAQKIIDDATKLIAPGVTFQLYFIYKGAKNVISEKNFVKPYDEITEMIERKQSID